MVNITKDQTSNAPSVTGWSSIHLVEQSVIGETSDLLSWRYILQWASDSSNILQRTWSMLLMSHPRFGYSRLEGSMKIMQEIRMSNVFWNPSATWWSFIKPSTLQFVLGLSMSRWLPISKSFIVFKISSFRLICFLKKSWIVSDRLNNNFFHIPRGNFHIHLAYFLMVF